MQNRKFSNSRKDQRSVEESEEKVDRNDEERKGKEEDGDEKAILRDRMRSH